MTHLEETAVNRNSITEYLNIWGNFSVIVVSYMLKIFNNIKTLVMAYGVLSEVQITE